MASKKSQVNWTTQGEILVAEGQSVRIEVDVEKLDDFQRAVVTLVATVIAERSLDFVTRPRSGHTALSAPTGKKFQPFNPFVVEFTINGNPVPIRVSRGRDGSFLHFGVAREGRRSASRTRQLLQDLADILLK